jgi:type IV pilus assembly protein PilQ
MNSYDHSFGGKARVLVVASMLAVVVVIAAAMPLSAVAAIDSAPRATLKDYHFTDIPVRSVLQLLAEEGQINLVVSDSVEGTISLHLTDVTWEQALAVVLQLKGLEQYGDRRTRSVTVAGG